MAVTILPIQPGYFEPLFGPSGFDESFPRELVMVAAQATAGEHWATKADEEIDYDLNRELLRSGVWNPRMAGFSIVSDHAEPSWATTLPFTGARDFARNFLEDAIYFVSAQHNVDHALWRLRKLIPAGLFRIRSRG